MLRCKIGPLAVATLAALFSLGLAPIAKAHVEMVVDPYSIYIPPGGEVNFTLTITNHDPVSYRCRLAVELRKPDGGTVHYPDRHFTLWPHQSISREVSRTAPYSAPLGVYELCFYLYDRDTGQLLATTHLRILVG
jgi:hypothetical protein